MKSLFKVMLLAVCMVIVTSVAFAQVHVKGYTRKDGTYVQPHYRSNPDGNPHNNWSTRGNVNPYTGAVGTRNVDSYNSSPYNLPRLNSGSSYGGYGSQNRDTNQNNSYGRY